MLAERRKSIQSYHLAHMHGVLVCGAHHHRHSHMLYRIASDYAWSPYQKEWMYGHNDDAYECLRTQRLSVVPLKSRPCCTCTMHTHTRTRHMCMSIRTLWVAPPYTNTLHNQYYPAAHDMTHSHKHTMNGGAAQNIHPHPWTWTPYTEAR